MAERGPVPARRKGTGKGRPTLGLVTANIHLGVGATLWSGVLAAAERCDVNLVCFPGGPLRPAGAPRTALYELVGPERLDGVICWTSTLGLPRPTATSGPPGWCGGCGSYPSSASTGPWRTTRPSSWTATPECARPSAIW
ncbi:hypothetical protein LUW77_03860 [Streptomyces radiopugnans]|nr:hypothetical protein LUW77_03860 [Streptomyces radiopugnans]